MKTGIYKDGIGVWRCEQCYRAVPCAHEPLPSTSHTHEPIAPLPKLTQPALFD